jgi:two-component system, OmpR family, phosphate regulon sensor histidine kinase PhoR
MIRNKTLRSKINFRLIYLFIFLFTCITGIALFLGYELVQRYVANNFSTLKSEIYDSTIEPYNDLLFKSIPQISLYKGYLNQETIENYTDNIFKDYAFVDSITFYDVFISNQAIEDGIRSDRFSVEVKGIYNIERFRGLKSTFVQSEKGNFSLNNATEFGKSVLKFVSFIAEYDSNKTLNDNDLFNIFYTFGSLQLSYLNVPGNNDLVLYKRLMQEDMPKSEKYNHDVLTFHINPQKLLIRNTLPDWYEKILIRPVSFDTLISVKDAEITSLTLPSTFSEYKMMFISSRAHLDKVVKDFYTPIVGIIAVVYFLTITVFFLIIRNLKANAKLFEQQYEFINTLTHEFKTPLSVIKILGSNIRSIETEAKEELQMYSKIIDDETTQLNELINKLLSYTQLENRSIALRLQEIDVYEFLAVLVDHNKINYKNLKINIKAETGIPLIRSDEVLLNSIFQNIIDNAYKYSQQENKIIDIEVNNLRKFVQVTFRDYGIGISKQELKYIFKKFYRVETGYNAKGSVGLGLAFVKEVLDLMGGKVSVSSELGVGTTFRIQLPKK